MLALTSGDARVTLLPAVGGAVGSFSVAGRDILRPTPDGADDALDTACFPLVPFANRIPDGRFSFGRHDVALAPNLADHPHALHGSGWRSAWTAGAVTASSATLRLDHPAGEWPWAWRAEQRIALTPTSLSITLELQNLSDDPMPAGLGLHPYFPAPAVLRTPLDGRWNIAADCLPTGHQARPFESLDIPTPALTDHCHTGWTGAATITPPGGVASTITASSNCRFLHIFSQPGADFFCAEPVTHRPDPFAAPDTGLAVLASGQSLSVWMKIAVG